MDETVLCYIENEYGEYLMLYRNKEENDLNIGKCLGIGGHIEKGETPDEALVREVYEETTLRLTNYRKRGTVVFKSESYSELIHLYTAYADKFSLGECNEGHLFWILKNKIFTLPLWQGDVVFLKKLINDEENFNLILHYENDKFIRSEEI